MSKNPLFSCAVVPPSVESGDQATLKYFDQFIRPRIEGRLRTLEHFSPVAKDTVGTKYRFRAECPRDADLFLRAISRFIEPSWTMTPLTYYPDVVVSFEVSKEISPRDLLWIAFCISDGHVLVQTLEKNCDYTGKRDYDRELDIHDPETMPSAAVLAEMRKGLAWYVKSLKFLLADAKEFAANLQAIAS